MLARALGLLTVASLAAVASAGCGPAPTAPAAPARAAAPRPPGPAASAAGSGARYFQGLPEESFWVTHARDRDRVVVAGARLELSPAGEVLEAAWEGELWATAEVIQGSLAVPAPLGGGYVHWTRAGVYRSGAFTGPLEPVALGVAGASVRGARLGLRSVVVFTDAGPREILPGEARARAFPEPGLHDIAAIDGKRAARLDLFGRAQITGDGGATWTEVAAQAGLSGRALVPAPEEITIETWLGRVVFGAGGLSGIDTEYRSTYMAGRQFQVRLPGTLVDEREEQPWAWRDITPLGAAALGGAALPDGTAIAVGVNGAARVDLRTGAATDLDQGWIPDGLSCTPHRAPDAALLLCGWDDYRGYGGYVLRTTRGEPPVIEKELSDDGFFVADDRGAVGFVGSCGAGLRAPDPEARGNAWGEIMVAPTVCVRRGRGDWVERAVELGDRRSLLAWVPRRDGSAIALVRGAPSDLPPAVGVPEAQDEGGVRVIRLRDAGPGWFWTRAARRGYGVRGGSAMVVDRRFQAREDGGVAAWLSSAESQDAYGLVSAGATVAADGSIAVHGLPPDPAGMLAGGTFGLVATARGELYETLDHGRSWRPAGASPVPPAALQGGCSEIGCALSGLVRVGWGAAAIRPAITPDPQAACRVRNKFRAGGGAEAACQDAARRLEARDAAEPPPRLACAPAGLPAPRAAAPGPGDRRGGQGSTVELGYGDEISVVREADAPEPPPEPDPAAAPPGGSAPAPAPTSRSAAPKPNRAPALRTHALLFRPPFDPAAPLVRLNATNAAVVTRNPNSYRRPTAVPLLAPGGEVALLLLGEAGEAVVGARDVVPLPTFEPRRFYVDQTMSASGLLLAPDRAAILAENRRRTYLEEHGPDPQRPPRAVALDRELFRRRPLTVARRDDGALGLLVLDGIAAETAGVAPLDRAAGTPGKPEPLAPWSTLTAGSDPRCKAPREAWTALLVAADPSAALRLDAGALPGVSLGEKGLLLVRWGKDRVCLDAFEAVVVDPRRRGAASPSARLIARWSGGGQPGASLVSAEMIQPLSCAVAPEGGAPRSASARP